jgi:hypothetical protein
LSSSGIRLPGLLRYPIQFGCCATPPATSASTASSRVRSSSAAVRRRARQRTNDKAGSILNLVRWISPRTIKETFAPARSFEYPFMSEK